MMTVVLPFDKTVILIPTYNESANVALLLATIFDLYPDITVLIIDDNSPDGTASIVRDLKNTKHPNLELLERSDKFGLGTAYIEGIKWALGRDYQFIFEMDCDFSHDPIQVKDLLVKAQSCDLVVGSRYIDGIRIVNWPIHRLLLSYFASMYVRLITRIPMADAMSGFKCFTRKALQEINLDNVISRDYLFQLELNYKVWSAGLDICEVPIIFYERRQGRSKMGSGVILESVLGTIYLSLRRLVGKIN